MTWAEFLAHAWAPILCFIFGAITGANVQSMLESRRRTQVTLAEMDKFGREIDELIRQHQERGE